MTEKKIECVYCKCGDDLVPLISLAFKGEDYYICTDHLPVLLHKPHLFGDKLVGFEPKEE